MMTHSTFPAPAVNVFCLCFQVQYSQQAVARVARSTHQGSNSGDSQADHLAVADQAFSPYYIRLFILSEKSSLLPATLDKNKLFV